MKKQFLATTLIALLASTPLFADVASERDKTKKGVAIGAIGGAIVGAVIGNNRGHHSAKRGAVVGTLAGAAAGAIVGNMMDKQERELRQINGVDVTRVDDDDLKVTVRNEVLFDTDSSGLRSVSKSALREMADVFDRYPNTTIVVEGHTDSTGSASYNERLSERRADSVASYLQTLGVSGHRVDTIGYGESQPKASNNTASGRQSNRRVELKIHANAA